METQLVMCSIIKRLCRPLSENIHYQHHFTTLKLAALIFLLLLHLHMFSLPFFGFMSIYYACELGLRVKCLVRDTQVTLMGQQERQITTFAGR